VALLRERPGPRRWIGLGVATVGVVLVALRVGVGGPVGAFVLVLGAAAAWALSNMAIRKGAPPNMLRFMVWVSAVATLPLFGLSLALEGARGRAALHRGHLHPGRLRRVGSADPPVRGRDRWG